MRGDEKVEKQSRSASARGRIRVIGLKGAWLIEGRGGWGLCSERKGGVWPWRVRS